MSDTTTPAASDEPTDLDDVLSDDDERIDTDVAKPHEVDPEHGTTAGGTPVENPSG